MDRHSPLFIVRARLAAALALCASALLWPAAAGAAETTLSDSNNTPFPSSSLITGASWTSAPYGPPSNQFGDILSNSAVSQDGFYVLMDDGGTDTTNGALWRNSFARVTGSPGDVKFSPVGTYSAPSTYEQVDWNERLLTGPLGSHYSMGFTIVNGVFYATQTNDWDWTDNGPFDGLSGIAYSTDLGKHWHFGGKPFAGATGNLNFVQFGENAPGPGGYVYAIATEREFNASNMILGRARADITDITNPARWQWASGTRRGGKAKTMVWSSSLSRAQPILTWTNHITYPRLSYDAALHRYLLTFTYSYAASPPAMWQNGSELVVLESPTPAGPFYFVARDSYFGPSNGYDPGLPVNWMSPNGSDLWMIWAANFDGCAGGLDCSGAYGFNYQRLTLTLAKAPFDPDRRHRQGPVYASQTGSRRPDWQEELAEDW